ncbi:MAG: hypothetical protein ACYC27_13095 [Armatimonadota bacterium]
MIKHLSIVFIILLSLTICAIASADSTVRGVVADESGKAVSGAKVTMLTSVDNSDGIVIGSAVSGPNGAFKLTYPKQKPSIFKRSLSLVVSDESRLGFLNIMNPRAAQRITCFPRGIVLGMVKNIDGKPVQGAVVKPSMFTRNAFLGQQYVDFQSIEAVAGITPATTDSRGVFTISGLPLGWEAHLTVYNGGLEGRRPKDWTGNWSSTLSALPETDSETRAVRMTFIIDTTPVDAGKIIGKLFDTSEKPMPGVNISVIRIVKNEPVRGEKPAYAVTKSDGSFVFDSLAVGTYTLSIFEVDQPVQPETDVRVYKNDTTEVGMYAEPGTPVQGRVVDGVTGKGIPGITVASLAAKPVTTGADGSFTINVLAGRGMVYANGESAGYYPQSKDVDVPEVGKVSGVMIKLMKIQKLFGQVRDASGKPVDGAWVQPMWPKNPGDLLQTDELGNYEIVLDNRTSVILLASNQSLNQGAVKTVKLTGKSQKLDIKLLPASSVRGVVKNERGEGVNGAKITTLIVLGNYRVSSIENIAVSDITGGFTIRGLIPGAVYVFRVKADGYKELTTEPANTPKLMSGKTVSTVIKLTSMK